MNKIDGARILVTGGTGSLGKVLIRRLLSGRDGMPAKIICLSRDEAKQHQMRVEYMNRGALNDDAIYQGARELLAFRIGDVRDYASVAAALQGIDIVFNTAALKQVPACEYFPSEAIRTNIGGAENIVRAIRELGLPVKTVVGISTDKAVKPVNVMGMTKSIQERVFAQANLDAPGTRFVIVRYGNVLASRGSVIPLFHTQIEQGGPLTITDSRMTRFLLSLEDAVDVVLTAVNQAERGETYIPRIPAARMVDVAAGLIGKRAIKIVETGIRPGEKLHECLISEEEAARSFRRGDYYVIGPLLPELRGDSQAAELVSEYTSETDLLTPAQVVELLEARKLMVGQVLRLDGDFLR